MLLSIAMLVLQTNALQPAHAAGIVQARALIRAECAAGRFSGVMAITSNAREIAFEQCGKEHYPDGTAISRASRFKLFSTSKQLTAAAMVLLAAERKLSLDDKVARWLPEAPATWREATIRNLLMHRAGIPDDINGYVKFYKGDATAAILQWLAANEATPLAFKPGTEFRYSNMGYEMLAAIAERADRRPWPDIMRRRVFAPAGMKGALIESPLVQESEVRGPAPDPGLVHGYNGAPGSPEEAGSFAFVLRASGAVHGAVDDLIAYERALAEKRLLSGQQQSAMIDGAVDRYGLGWIVRRTPAGRVTVSHSGGTNGYAIEYARIPDLGLAVILLNNFGFSDVEDYRGQIVAALDPAPAAPGLRP